MAAIHPLNNSQLQSNVNAASYTLTNVVDPSSNQDMATKKYVDDADDGIIGTYLADHPHQDVQTTASPAFATLYVDEYIYHTGDVDTYLWFDSNEFKIVVGGEVVLWVDPLDAYSKIDVSLDMQNNKITGLPLPVSNTDAATKSYVDTTDVCTSSFHVNKNNVNQAIPSGGATVTWANAVLNDGADFNLSTEAYIVPATGVYHFEAGGRIGNLNAGQRAIIGINRSSATIAWGMNYAHANGDSPHSTVSITTYCVIADPITVGVSHTYGSDRDLDGNNSRCWFSGFRVK